VKGEKKETVKGEKGKREADGLPFFIQ